MLAAANSCPTAPGIRRASCTSGRWPASAPNLERLGIERAGERAEPEDHIAILCDVMAGMARGDFAGGDLGTQEKVLRSALKPWALRFFADLETVKRADFYRSVGLYGRLFFELESEAFALPDEAAA